MARRGHGEGSVYKRGKRYAYLLPRQLTGPGERGYRGGFATKREAQDALMEAVAAARKGLYVKRTTDTLREYVDEVFMPKERAQRRPGTAAGYEQLLRVHVLPHVGDMKLQAITPVHLQRIWTGMQAGELGRPAVSARTVRMAYTVTRKVFGDALDQQLVTRNPAEGSNPPSREATQPPPLQVWSLDQLRAFLDHVRQSESAVPDPTPVGGEGTEQLRTCRTCEADLPLGSFPREPKGRDGLKADCRTCYGMRRRERAGKPPSAIPSFSDDRLYPLFLLAATTGMRRGELCGLRWQDVDLEAAVLHVRMQYTSDGRGGWAFSEPKTRNSRRTIPLDEATVEELTAHRARQAERRLALGPAYQSDPLLVFARADGSPLRPPQVTKRFRQLAVEADLPPLKFHGLRHSVATLLTERDLAATSAMLGHHDPAFTVRQYVHTDVERMRRLYGDQ